MINPRSSSKEESPLLVMGQSPGLARTRAVHFFRAQALSRLRARLFGNGLKKLSSHALESKCRLRLLGLNFLDGPGPELSVQGSGLARAQYFRAWPITSRRQVFKYLFWSEVTNHMTIYLQQNHTVEQANKQHHEESRRRCDDKRTKVPKKPCLFYIKWAKVWNLLHIYNRCR